MDGLVNEPTHRCSAHLDHLARRMRLHAERVLDPLCLRPHHLVALTVLRDRSGITQQALSATLMLDRANIVGLLNDFEGAGLVERIRSTLDRRRHLVHDRGGAFRLATAECALAAAVDPSSRVDSRGAAPAYAPAGTPRGGGPAAPPPPRSGTRCGSPPAWAPRRSPCAASCSRGRRRRRRWTSTCR
ncbi:MAG: MarR family transcriptional regulator [Pseudonocardia sp.]|nr:MAG: MarR family transcriptional regulator [Pseudonocardia sp.]